MLFEIEEGDILSVFQHLTFPTCENIYLNYDNLGKSVWLQGDGWSLFAMFT